MADGLVSISVSSDIERLSRHLSSVQRQQIPFAARTALNKIVDSSQLDIKKAIRRVFDRPTPFTLSSTFGRYATKSVLQASIGLKDEAGKGIAAAKYLKAEVEGGARATKRSERALSAAGLLPSGYYAVPSTSVKLDAFGNVRSSLIVKILSDLRSFNEQGFRANRRTKAEAIGRGKRFRAARYFVVPVGVAAQAGIYERKDSLFGRGAQPVFIFVRRANYRARLDIERVVNDRLREDFDKVFSTSLDRALATARP